ncbi:hypothetical protein J2T56_002563 [Natronobacillus azotifigens]|uniref:Peptidase C39-like domain-containing protein n=1 Tax=Natronobacillus azotifigens TaxID=472978 RepID=A0A9J6RFR1_9BACI|nr:hypothetical protein [Natronobacillus azotifigens]MCZ0704261.1 hypothetical protein [Natronobacillus azotifigens]
MKILKRIKLSILLFVLLLFVVPSSIFAAGTGDDPKPTKNIPTTEDLRELERKSTLVENHLSNQYTISANGEMKTLGVTAFKQSTGYWCGPATVKQVIHFFRNISGTQQFYADRLGTTTAGTDFSKIPGVLNSYQTENRYIYQSYNSNEFLSWRSALILSRSNRP